MFTKHNPQTKVLRRSAVISLTVALFVSFAPVAFAQKGKGDAEGVARSLIPTQRITVSGTLLRIKDGPCENTTGRFPTGMHLFLKTKKGKTINLHLGPTEVVQSMVKNVSKGTEITARAFRTKAFEKNECVAIHFKTKNKTFRLRDAETLRPFWAGQPAAPAAGDQNRMNDGRQRAVNPPGSGEGYRRGGYGRQRGGGWGRGGRWGRGRGWNRGEGFGRGRGRGRW